MSLPYFPFYADDYEADTTHLTMNEDGAYNRLLRLCWRTTGCSIPEDRVWVYRRMRALSDEDKRSVETVLDEFFQSESGRLSNARLTREWMSANEAHDRRKTAGAKGGKSNALKRNTSVSSGAAPKPKQPELEPKPEPEPVFKRQDTSVSFLEAEHDHLADVREATRIYNSAAVTAGWPKVQTLTKAREAALRARLRDLGGVDGWRHALERAFLSDFLNSCIAGREWTGFGFDWITRTANFNKLMEGNYDNRTDNPTGAGGKARKGGDRILDEIADAAGIGRPSGNGGA